MPLSRRQIYRRRRVTVFGTLAIVLGLAFYLPTTLLAPLHASAAELTSYTAPTSAAAAITWPTYGASAIGAVGYEGVLSTGGSDQQLPMASISKIITALVVLDSKPLNVDDPGPNITFSQADVALYNHYLALNGSLEPVRGGLVLSELQVLQLALIPSANNYAASLVNWAYGSSDKFVPVAQAWLTKHGLSNTTMIEPTGIDPSNTATASDLVALGKLAIANPVIAKIVSTASVAIPGVGTVKNTNELLGIDGVTGLKTGTLDTFGANLLFSATETVGTDSITLVGVVLGGTTHPKINTDIQAALTATVAGFHEVTLVKKGQKFGSYTTAWGSSNLVAATDASALVWSNTPVTAKVSAKAVATGAEGADVGKLAVTIGTNSYSIPLELSHAVTEPGSVWRLTHPAALL